MAIDIVARALAVSGKQNLENYFDARAEYLEEKTFKIIQSKFLKIKQ